MTKQYTAVVMLTLLATGQFSRASEQEKKTEINGVQRLPTVWGMEFSPDGRWLAAATGTLKQGGPIVVWNVETWQPHIVRFEDHGGSHVVFSPDGKRLAYTTKGEFAVIVDVASRDEIRRWKVDETRAFSIDYSPDGKVLATSASDGTVKLWNANSGELLKSLQGHAGDVLHAAFSPDGRRLLSAGQDATAKVWDVQTGKVIWKFEPSSSIVRRVRWSRDGRYFLTSRWDGYARIRDAATGTLLGYFRGGQRWADLTADNQLLATTGWNVEAHVYRIDLRPLTAKRDEQLRQLIAKFSDDDYEIRESASLEIAKIGMPAARILREFNKSSDAEFRIRARRLRRQVMSPEPIAKLKGHAGDVEVVCFSPDGKWIATGCRRGDVKVWDATTFQLRISLQLPPGQSAE